jgi:hypothetical protein
MGVALACAGAPLAAQTPTAAEVRAALDAAVEARNEATRARAAAEAAAAKADAAILAAERTLAAIGAPLTTVPAPPPVATADISPATPCSVALTADAIARNAVEFQSCLGLKGWTHFDIADLNTQLTAKLVDTRIEVGPTFTLRWGPPSEAEAGRKYRTAYLKTRAAFLAQVGSDSKTAAFADLTDTGHASGMGYMIGLEYGVSGARLFDDPLNKDGYVDDVQKGLDAAARDCRVSASADLVPAEAVPGNSAFRTQQQIIDHCSGQNLLTWMRDEKNRSKYYRSIVQPIWGNAAKPEWYGGVDWRWRKPEYPYIPLKDPAGTGIPLVAAIPADTTKQKEEVWALRGYIGHRPVPWLDLSASLSYRRDFVFPKGTGDQDVCPLAGGSFTICGKYNIAPPLELKGLVVGARAAVEIPRVGFLPNLASELKVTHDFETNQWGFQVPFYFVVDDKNVPNAGVLFGCTTGGRAAFDTLLPKDCKASVFLSTSFNIDGRP